MHNISWNSFVTKHKSPIGFAAVVSATLPKGPHFDKNKKKLPTPYALFKEWCEQSLSNEWSSQKFKGGFIVCVSSQSDAQLIQSAFKILNNQPKNTPACAKTYQIGYTDAGYGALAKTLGYAI